MLGHAPVELPTVAALFAKRTHASCDASAVAQSTVGRRPNVRIIDEGERMCVERSCMTRPDRRYSTKMLWVILAEKLPPNFWIFTLTKLIIQVAGTQPTCVGRWS